MRFVIQRVSGASVTVDGVCISEIGKGFLVLVGIRRGDSKEMADRLIRKMSGLRIFEDPDGKTNLSLHAVGGEVLMVSQFTLYADCKKGNRPSFVDAAGPQEAKPLYEYILDKTKEEIPTVKQGCFGAHMDIRMCADGPFTIVLDSDELKKQEK